MAKKTYRYDVALSVDVTAESEEEAERLLHEGFRERKVRSQRGRVRAPEFDWW